ncbi:MAG: DUF3137 domain-containing protein [Sandarakinorhabdus sp.]|nr:DUF3137 domain-containing protein [Sandarakinorhabdus sp.]
MADQPPPVTPRGNPALAKLVLLAGLALGLALWVFVISAGIAQGQVLTGIFSGLIGGLFVAAAASWLGMRILSPPAAPAKLDEAKADRVTAGLGAVLAELEAVRKSTVEQINARARLRVPICALAGLGLWLLPDSAGAPKDFSDLLGGIGFGALIGYTWAASKLGAAYRLLYKQRVLPLLAAQFGDLSWRVAVLPDLERFREAGIFEKWQSASADDELYGTHRNLPLSIIELRLTSSSGDSETVQFNGLLVEITLPRGLRGSTAIIASEGLIGKLREWIGRDGRSRVRLEDPKFDEIYEAWSTDQIAARALLTPAFMERLLALAARNGVGRPMAIADDNRLTMAIPRFGSALFEPPSYAQPAASRDRLVQLYDDIAAVLAVADSVIALDYAATARASDA